MKYTALTANQPVIEVDNEKYLETPYSGPSEIWDGLIAEPVATYMLWYLATEKRTEERSTMVFGHVIVSNVNTTANKKRALALIAKAEKFKGFMTWISTARGAKFLETNPGFKEWVTSAENKMRPMIKEGVPFPGDTM